MIAITAPYRSQGRTDGRVSSRDVEGVRDQAGVGACCGQGQAEGWLERWTNLEKVMRNMGVA